MAPPRESSPERHRDARLSRGASLLGGDSAQGASRCATWMAYLIIMLLGFGVLTPWNVLLNVIPFFQDLYPEHATRVAFYVTCAYTYPQVPLLLVMVGWGNRVPLRVRFLSVLALQALALALLPVLAPMGLAAALVLSFLLGVTTAVFQASVYGLASVLPELYSQGVMLGMGLAGVLASLAQIGVQVVFPGDDLATQQAAARWYFSFAAALMVACAVSYVVLERMPFTRYYLARAAGAPGEVDGDGAALVSGAGGGGDAGDEVELSGLLGEVAAKHAGGIEGADGAAASLPELAATAAAPPLTRWQLLRAVWVDSAAVFAVFFLSFVVFPSTAPYKLPYRGGLGLHFFDGHSDRWQLTLLLVFNVFDTLGRFLPGVVPSPLRGRTLLAASLARVALVVLFAGCALGWPGLGDVAALVIMVVFALTNGWLASLAMMQGPQVVREKDREAAGVLLSFWLQAGILVGSTAALAFV